MCFHSHFSATARIDCALDKLCNFVGTTMLHMRWSSPTVSQTLGATRSRRDEQLVLSLNVDARQALGVGATANFKQGPPSRHPSGAATSERAVKCAVVKI